MRKMLHYVTMNTIHYSKSEQAERDDINLTDKS